MSRLSSTWSHTGSIPASAVLRCVMSQTHFINGMYDGFRGELRRDRITIRMPVASPEPVDNRIVRFLRWLGA